MRFQAYIHVVIFAVTWVYRYKTVLSFTWAGHNYGKATHKLLISKGPPLLCWAYSAGGFVYSHAPTINYGRDNFLIVARQRRVITRRVVRYTYVPRRL